MKLKLLNIFIVALFLHGCGVTISDVNKSQKQPQATQKVKKQPKSSRTLLKDGKKLSHTYKLTEKKEKKAQLQKKKKQAALQKQKIALQKQKVALAKQKVALQKQKVALAKQKIALGKQKAELEKQRKRLRLQQQLKEVADKKDLPPKEQKDLKDKKASTQTLTQKASNTQSQKNAFKQEKKPLEKLTKKEEKPSQFLKEELSKKEQKLSKKESTLIKYTQVSPIKIINPSTNISKDPKQGSQKSIITVVPSDAQKNTTYIKKPLSSSEKRYLLHTKSTHTKLLQKVLDIDQTHTNLFSNLDNAIYFTKYPKDATLIYLTDLEKFLELKEVGHIANHQAKKSFWFISYNNKKNVPNCKNIDFNGLKINIIFIQKNDMKKVLSSLISNTTLPQVIQENCTDARECSSVQLGNPYLIY